MTNTVPMSYRRLRKGPLCLVSTALVLGSAACSASGTVTPRWDWYAERDRDPEAPSPEVQEPAEEVEQEYPHAASVFLGDTIIDGEHAVTIGIDYEYRFEEHIGVGGIFDLVLHDSLREAILAAALFLHPDDEIVILVAAGIDRAEEEENLFLFRTGVGYEFLVGERYFIAPTVYVDFVEGGEHATVLGVGFGIEF